MPAAIIMRRPVSASRSDVRHDLVRADAVFDGREVDIGLEGGAGLPLSMRRAIELAVAIIAAAHDDANGAIRIHRNERRLARPCATAFSLEGRLDGLLGKLLQRHVDGGARGEDELALAFHEPLHFLEGPIKEVVRDVDLLAIDDLRRIEPGAVHLALGHEPGLDKVA